MDFKSVNDISDSKYGKFACYDVLRLATVRGAELAAFESSVDVLTASALTGLQRLPVRLRRRAASHRVNRLPRRFHRHYHLSTSNNNGSQSESSVCKQKLKSRRYRRRKLRLLALHSRFMTNRCQNSSQNLKPAWLPTHIWHAKRFHMITKWGWRLPYSPTNKIFKACHKASHNGCLLFDFSYLNCFQVYGPEAMISNCLNCIFQLDCQVESLLPELTELKTPVQSCEQTGILYTTTKCVQHISRPVLGPVRILWGSRNSPKDNFRHIWLWLHPCISESAWRLLQSYIKETHLNNKTEDILHLSDLTGYFCRLHTIGRQSHGLISDILKVRDENDIKDDNWTFWNHLSTSIREAVCIPSGLVINLSNCEDFRSNRPRLKIRNQNWCVTPIKLSDNRSQQQQVTCASSTNESHFVLPSGKQLSWSDIKKSYPNIYPSPDELLSTELNRDSEESKTDIILIQNSTPSLVRLSPESIGWDIILRRNFPQSKNEQALLRGSLAARDFLIACVYRGSEVGGLRDLYHWAGLGTRGGGHFYSFPDTLWPDTPAGQESAQSVTEEKLNRLNHLPGNLRPDFVKFGVSQPFMYPWSELIKQNSSGIPKPTDSNTTLGITTDITPTSVVPSSDEITTNTTDWFVLREPALLRLVVHRMLVGDRRAKLSLQQLYNYNPSLLNALILVYLKAEHRGVPQTYGHIYAFYNNLKKRDFHSLPLVDEEKSNQHHRFLLGYVQNGGYGQSIGRGIGLGFISLSALSNALTQSHDRDSIIKYCIRNPTSMHYYTVRLSVVI